MVKLVLALAGVVVAAGADRAAVSRSLEERTGHPLGPVAPKASSLPPGLALGDRLSEDDAVAIALWNNAAFQADLASLGIARADLIEAGLLRNPNLSMLLPVGPKPFELAVSLPIEALWQRPRRVAAAKLNAEQVAQGLVQHGLDLVRDVRLAHADLAGAEQRRLLAGQASQLRSEIAELTGKRLQAGDIGESEAQMARIDARLAAEQAVRYYQDVDLARDRLRVLLGLRIEQAKWSAAAAAPAPPPDPDKLVAGALASRPDLRAAELAVEAAAKRAGWERSKIVAFGLMLSSKGVGTHGVRSGPGLSGDIPLFHRNQGAISRAQAEVEAAGLRYAALRDQVELEVGQARARLAQASDSLEHLRNSVLPLIRESIQLFERAYSAGDISYLTLLENSRQLHDAELREADALAAVRRAAAELDRNVGHRLP